MSLDAETGISDVEGDPTSLGGVPPPPPAPPPEPPPRKPFDEDPKKAEAPPGPTGPGAPPSLPRDPKVLVAGVLHTVMTIEATTKNDARWLVVRDRHCAAIADPLAELLVLLAPGILGDPRLWAVGATAWAVRGAMADFRQLPPMPLKKQQDARKPPEPARPPPGPSDNPFDGGKDAA